MCLPLPEAYRSLPRPSSPVDAKASVVRPYIFSRKQKKNTLVLDYYCNSQTMQFSKNHPCLCRVHISPKAENFRTFSAFALANSLVGVPGIEPGTSSLSGMRSNQLSYTPDSASRLPRLQGLFGGGNRIRTGDIVLAKHALYQLSYAPKALSPVDANRLFAK